MFSLLAKTDKATGNFNLETKTQLLIWKHKNITEVQPKDNTAKLESVSLT